MSTRSLLKIISLRAAVAAVVAAAVVFAGAPSVATAGNSGPRNNDSIPFTEADGTSFASEALSGTPQTSVIEVAGYRFVTFYLNIASVTGTINIDLDCNFGPTTADVNYPAQSRAIASGVATYSDYTARKSVTTSKKYPVRLEVHGYNQMQCTFTGTSGTVNASLYGGVD